MTTDRDDIGPRPAGCTCPHTTIRHIQGRIYASGIPTPADTDRCPIHGPVLKAERAAEGSSLMVNRSAVRTLAIIANSADLLAQIDALPIVDAGPAEIRMRYLTPEELESFAIAFQQSSEVVGRLDVVNPAATSWQDISTAPRDRFILLYCAEDHSRWLAKWQGGKWFGVDDMGLTRTGRSEGDPNDVTGWVITGWADLPPPPARKTDEVRL